jgi:hypothetical protein
MMMGGPIGLCPEGMMDRGWGILTDSGFRNSEFG